MKDELEAVIEAVTLTGKLTWDNREQAKEAFGLQDESLRTIAEEPNQVKRLELIEKRGFIVGLSQQPPSGLELLFPPYEPPNGKVQKGFRYVNFEEFYGKFPDKFPENRKLLLERARGLINEVNKLIGTYDAQRNAGTLTLDALAQAAVYTMVLISKMPYSRALPSFIQRAEDKGAQTKEWKEKSADIRQIHSAITRLAASERLPAELEPLKALQKKYDLTEHRFWASLIRAKLKPGSEFAAETTGWVQYYPALARLTNPGYNMLDGIMKYVSPGGAADKLLSQASQTRQPPATTS